MNMRTVQEQERYINPYTDFGFKKLFGTELNKDCSFEQAEIAKFTPKERQEYEESMKEYRDYYNTVETAHNNGHAEGLAEGHAKGRNEEKVENARKMKSLGLGVDIISQVTGLSPDEVNAL